MRTRREHAERTGRTSLLTILGKLGLAQESKSGRGRRDGHFNG